VEVLLCIEAATELDVGCQVGDTYCRCFFVLTGEVYFAEEFAMADAIAVKALALRTHVPGGEGVLLLIVVLPELLFLV
jgi:hypothetical protein